MVHTAVDASLVGTSAQAGVDMLTKIEQPIGGGCPARRSGSEKKSLGDDRRLPAFVNEKANSRVVVSVTSERSGIVAAPRPMFVSSAAATSSAPPSSRHCRSRRWERLPTTRRFREDDGAGTEAVRCRWAWTADGTARS